MISRRFLLWLGCSLFLAFALVPAGYHDILLSAETYSYESSNVDLLGVAEGGRSYSVAVSGTTVCAGFYDVFTVLNAADPSNLKKESSLLMDPSVVGIRISGNFAYVANYTGGLRVIDVSTPSQPVEVGHNDAGGDVLELSISGNYAFVAAGTAGLKVIDISSPASPIEVGSYDTPGRAFHVVTSGNYAYIADYDSGMRVIDISTLSSPAEVGYLITGGLAYGIDISGDYVFLADHSNGLHAIDVSDKSNPIEVGSYSTPDVAYGVTVEGSYAYVSSGSGGYRIIDISTPGSLFEIGHFDQPSFAHESAISGNYAYVAENYAGLTVVNISNPSNPFKEESYGGWPRLRDIDVVDGYAYMSADDDIIRVADISEASKPSIIGHLPWGIITVYGIEVSGSYAYVGKDNNLLIIDISSPESPTYCCSFGPMPGGEVRSMAISGNLLYVALGSFGLRIVEMLTPTSLINRGSAITIGLAYDVAVSGQYAYLLDGAPGLGLRVIDVADSLNPVEVGSYNTSGVARAIALEGDYAYIADYGSGLKIIDISIPSAPTKIGEYTSSYTAAAVDVAVTSYGYAYLADEVGGVRVIEVIDKASPTEAGYFSKTGEIVSVAAADDKIFLTDRSSGLLVMKNMLIPTSVNDKSSPMVFALYQNTPNPFNPNTTIRYSIKETGRVTLIVYDVTGRLVKRLVDEVQLGRAGDYSVTWDGRNEANEPVSSGVYFCRLVSQNSALTKKMVFLK